MQQDLISVIIPVYNVEKYLRKCLDSVVSQTYNNLEILIVDDGSTDCSGQICDEYAEKDDRIQVFHQLNCGLSKARNTGIDLSTGDYLMFIDSDDYISKDMAMELYNELKKSNADMSICNFHYVDENNNIIKTKELDFHNAGSFILTKKELLNALTNSNISTAIVIGCNKLYKNSIFDSLRYPVGRIYEDEFIIHHILNKIDKAVLINRKYYYYIKRDNSITHTNYTIKNVDAIEAILDRAKFLYDLEEYLFSAYSLDRASTLLLEAKARQNKTNHDGCQKLHHLKKERNRLCFKLATKPIPLKTKCILCIFVLGYSPTKFFLKIKTRLKNTINKR